LDLGLDIELYIGKRSRGRSNETFKNNFKSLLIEKVTEKRKIRHGRR